MRTLYHSSRPVFWLVTANMALYALFMVADVYGGDSFMAAVPSSALKYASICVCFAISFIVFLRAPYSFDASMQSIILAFTLVADFLILFTPHFTEGIAVFCCAHLTAVCRYGGTRRARVMAAVAAIATAALIVVVLIHACLYPQSIPDYEGFDGEPGFATILTHTFAEYSPSVAIAPYAILITSATVFAFKRRQARANNILSRLGMVLFMLCDVNVLLWNIREGASLTSIPAWTATLMWAFYLPGQTMLALSAMDFGDSDTE